MKGCLGAAGPNRRLRGGRWGRVGAREPPSPGQLGQGPQRPQSALAESALPSGPGRAGEGGLPDGGRWSEAHGPLSRQVQPLSASTNGSWLKIPGYGKGLFRDILWLSKAYVGTPSLNAQL